jgi:hypothetical protein
MSPRSASRLLVLLPLLAAGSTVRAQAPILQDGADAVRQAWLAWAVGPPSSKPTADETSLEVGLGGAGGRGPGYSPILGGEGFGTAVRGGGAAVQGRWRHGGWTLEGTLLAWDQTGRSQASLQRGGISYRSERGWRFALEQQPIQWGFGLTGGYLLGTSARPFPRFSLETPWKDLHLFRVPLGQWKVETFMGRLEWDRSLPQWMSNPETQKGLLAAKGNIRRPDLSGFRLRGAFGPNVELNLGLTSMWGGVRRDGSRTRAGYSASDYLLGFFGAENIAQAEASGDPTHPDVSGYKAISNAIANAEARVRIPPLARLLKAEGTALYLSRGAENVNWQWKDFLKDPFGALAHDLRFDLRQLRGGRGRLLSSTEESFWGNNRRQAAPALDHVNDVVGLQIVWPRRWSLGLEYADTVNIPWFGGGYRTYSHWEYLSGQTRFGDFLGMAFGGDAITRTLDLGFPLGSKGQGHWILVRGTREFRDDPVLWAQVHPGLPPSHDPFLFAQVDLSWDLEGSRLGLSASGTREAKADFLPDNVRNTWNATASWSWKLF